MSSAATRQQPRRICQSPQRQASTCSSTPRGQEQSGEVDLSSAADRGGLTAGERGERRLDVIELEDACEGCGVTLDALLHAWGEADGGRRRVSTSVQVVLGRCANHRRGRGLHIASPEHGAGADDRGHSGGLRQAEPWSDAPHPRRQTDRERTDARRLSEAPGECAQRVRLAASDERGSCESRV